MSELLLSPRKRAERARYEAAARLGSATLNRALRAPYRAAEGRIGAMPAGSLVLDYGSGLGVHSIGPARCGLRVVGVDLSPRSIAVARERAIRDGKAARCRFVAGDCERLPFPARTFDLVLSMGTLSSLNHDRAFAEMARVVKPDGRAIVVDTLGHNPLLNLNRRWLFLRGRRTRWELDHVPTMRTLALAGSHFREARVEFFGLTTPLLVPLCRGEGALSSAMAALGERADRLAMRLGPLRRMAFKFVCTLTGPER